MSVKVKERYICFFSIKKTSSFYVWIFIYLYFNKNELEISRKSVNDIKPVISRMKDIIRIRDEITMVTEYISCEIQEYVETPHYLCFYSISP